MFYRHHAEQLGITQKEQPRHTNKNDQYAAQNISGQKIAKADNKATEIVKEVDDILAQAVADDRRSRKTMFLREESAGKELSKVRKKTETTLIDMFTITRKG